MRRRLKAKKSIDKKKAAALKKLLAAGGIKHSLVILGNPAHSKELSQSEKEVDVEIDAEEAEAWVNGIPLSLANGSGSTPLLPGHHILSFEVRGAPGTAWSVKITAPREAKAEDGDTFDRSGWDVGRIKFIVSA